MDKLKVKIIIGTTRPGRFGDKAGRVDTRLKKKTMDSRSSCSTCAITRCRSSTSR